MADDDLRPATRADLLNALSYGLRFRRRKPTKRYNELMAQLAAEALADLLDEAGLVVMKRPPLIGAAETLGRQLAERT